MSLIKDRIIYGCMMVGGDWNHEELSKEEIKKGLQALHAAYDIGIRQYDHANIYTFGKSEKVFAEFIKNSKRILPALNTPQFSYLCVAGEMNFCKYLHKDTSCFLSFNVHHVLT